MANKKQKICLVTGGAGFIGSHIVEGLLNAGYAVRVLDNLSEGSLANLEPYENDIEFIYGDIQNPDTLKQASQGIFAIHHHAAITSVHRSIQNQEETYSINVTGTLNVLEAAKTTGVQKIIFASSAATYGAGTRAMKTEVMNIKPISPYGVSKQIGEQLCESYSRHNNLETFCFRYFNVYGPRQNADSQYAGVISLFTKKLLDGERATIYGDGEQQRDFVNVLDIQQANLRALETQYAILKGQTTASRFNIFNIASGNAISVNTLYSTLEELTDNPTRALYKPERRGDIRDSQANISKARFQLGFVPRINLSKGLQTYVNSLKIREAKTPLKSTPQHISGLI